VNVSSVDVKTRRVAGKISLSWCVSAVAALLKALPLLLL